MEVCRRLDDVAPAGRADPWAQEGFSAAFGPGGSVGSHVAGGSSSFIVDIASGQLGFQY